MYYSVHAFRFLFSSGDLIERVFLTRADGFHFLRSMEESKGSCVSFQYFCIENEVSFSEEPDFLQESEEGE